ncbi:hypothetical protein M441DRAFT_310038 [Trichoderma asperellum CBS 433.97]|uniref:Uncharacterized protein n=1 Tax=Trichoderma asperellum (strain ATCC 204424 / CBS 433.97 / NBRC 101777) TaxID=1042311 RepID=A0A2T3ZK86_TRIA4|nr:hypothetical protein M441DRAFT_310038 [Trichoderma asperellum CBS 433.97]PTB45215.1 hypothetical protein M441DRAFT_310038 [Trichoderma asperellum CBS 433.97]
MVWQLPIRSALSYLNLTPPPPASPNSLKHLEASRETSPTCVGFKDGDLNSVSQLELVRGVTLRLTANTPAVFGVIALIMIPHVVKTKKSGRTPLICCSFLRIQCFVSSKRWLKQLRNPLHTKTDKGRLKQKEHGKSGTNMSAKSSEKVRIRASK